MKRIKNDQHNDNGFYYMAGLYIGRRLPNATMEFRKRFVTNFKRFVASRGGVESFRDPEDAIKQFSFEQERKGGKKRG